MPIAITASSTLRDVTLLLGDSITAGVGDTAPCESGGRGMYGRGACDAGPSLNYGVPGQTAQTLTAAGCPQLIAMAQEAGVTRGVLALGVNDISAGRTSAQILTELQRIRGIFPSLRWLDATVTPRTTSTDAYQTGAGQAVFSATNNTQRLALNDALRNGTAVTQGSLGVIDVASLLEASTTSNFPSADGGVWVPGTVGSDGLHPNTNGYERASGLVARAIRSL
jgi:lysophospholipase L1-like esterase